LWQSRGLLPRQIPVTEGWHNLNCDLIGDQLETGLTCSLRYMRTVRYYLLQHWLTVVHPPGMIHDSHCSVMCGGVNKCYEAGSSVLPISRPNPSGSFSMIERWWQSYPDQRPRLCHEAGSCMGYLRFFLYWLVIIFIQGRVLGCCSPQLYCARLRTLQILTAPGFHLLPRHKEPLQPTAQVKSSFEEQFSFYI